MRELRAGYRNRLPTRIAALETALDGICRQDADAVEALRRIAHQLRGSGATYGFPEISQAARDVEEAGHPDLPAALRALLAALRLAAESGSDDRAAILVVDDDVDLANYMKVLLEGPGREIHL